MFARSSIPYYFHSRANGRHRRRYGKPDTRRNIPSAFFGLVVTGLYAITMAEPNWFKLNGGTCSGRRLGLYTIFGFNVDRLRGICITDSVILKLRVCAGFALLGVATSMFQFGLDVCGSNRTCLNTIRKNSIGNIMSVLYTVCIMCLCYWITLDISKLTVKKSKSKTDLINVECRFDIAFYLVVGAGVASLIAATLGLLQITCEGRRNYRRRRHQQEDSDMQLQLMFEHPEVFQPSDIPMDTPPPVYQQ